MIIDYQYNRIILIHENDKEKEELNKLVADTEQDKGLMLWWGDTEYQGKELIAVQITSRLEKQFEEWGSKGGKKKGMTKVRGDSEYYRNIVKNRKKIDTKSD